VLKLYSVRKSDNSTVHARVVVLMIYLCDTLITASDKIKLCVFIAFF